MGTTASTLVIPRSEGDEESVVFLEMTDCRSLASLGMTNLFRLPPGLKPEDTSDVYAALKGHSSTVASTFVNRRLLNYFNKNSFTNITVA